MICTQLSRTEEPVCSFQSCSLSLADLSALQVSVDVPPGQCVELEIATIPYIKEGEVVYKIPIRGGISFWAERKFKLPPVNEWHYNYNVPVNVMIEVAEVKKQISCQWVGLGEQGRWHPG